MVTGTKAGAGGTTKEVLDRHWRDFLAGDVESILKDYAAEAFVITPSGTRRGLGEIRAAFQTMFAEIMPPGSSAARLSKEEIVGEVAFIVWSGTSEKYEIPFATDTFVIRGGKIVAQTFAPVMEKK
jgi:hypothetical protein